MKRRRGGIRPCKGQLDFWGELVEIARYKRDRVATERLVPMLAYLLKTYGSWVEVSAITGISAPLLRDWHGGRVKSVDRDHAALLVQVVMAHRKPADPFAFDNEVKRRLATREEADQTHRHQVREWRDYYRRRSRGEDVQPPAEIDTSRTPPRRKFGTA